MMMFARIVIGLMLASELFTEAFNLSLMTGSGRGEGQQHDNKQTRSHLSAGYYNLGKRHKSSK